MPANSALLSESTREPIDLQGTKLKGINGMNGKCAMKKMRVQTGI
jgi:hypothetical protein